MMGGITWNGEGLSVEGVLGGDFTSDGIATDSSLEPENISSCFYYFILTVKLIKPNYISFCYDYLYPIFSDQTRAYLKKKK